MPLAGMISFLIMNRRFIRYAAIVACFYILIFHGGNVRRLSGAEVFGPRGGSYHLAGVLGPKDGSIYTEWLISQDGHLTLQLYRAFKGRVVPFSPPAGEKIRPVSVWVSRLGNEGFSAQNFLLNPVKPQEIQGTEDSMDGARACFMAEIPGKLLGHDLYVVVPELFVGDRKLLCAGPVSRGGAAAAPAAASAPSPSKSADSLQP